MSTVALVYLSLYSFQRAPRSQLAHIAPFLFHEVYTQNRLSVYSNFSQR